SNCPRPRLSNSVSANARNCWSAVAICAVTHDEMWEEAALRSIGPRTTSPTISRSAARCVGVYAQYPALGAILYFYAQQIRPSPGSIRLHNVSTNRDDSGLRRSTPVHSRRVPKLLLRNGLVP